MKLGEIDRRVAVAWGGVAVLLALLLFFPLTVYWGQYNKYEHELNRDSRVLQKLQEIVGAKEYILRAYDAFEREGVQGLVYSTDQSAMQISLDIQKRLTDIVSRNGGIVQTVTPQVSKGDNYTAAGVRINLLGSVESLIGILHDIENARPLMIIEEMDIKQQWQRSQVRRQVRRSSGGQPPQVEEQKVLVQLTASSYASRHPRET